MGIKGLPEVLRPWLKPVQVGKYAGKRAAVDAYSWLHKGAASWPMAGLFSALLTSNGRDILLFPPLKCVHMQIYYWQFHIHFRLKTGELN